MLTYLVMLILTVNVTAVEKVSSMRVAGREVAPIGVIDKAAIPREINFQGYLTDADADTALSGNYDMIFKIYDAGTGGNVLWNESWIDVSVDGGIFNVILGETQAIPDSVFLDYTNLWLELLIEGETLTPRQKIVSVGRAYKAAHADTSNYAANAGASSTSAYADSSGISAYSWDGLHATRADTADYALAANVVSVDSATYADTANYAINAGTASTAAYADSAGVAAYAHEAGHATYADTAQYTIGGGSTAYADSAGVAAYAYESGHSVNSDTAQWSLGVGSAAYADSAGHLVVPDSLEATVNQGLNALLWLKNKGTGSGIMVDSAGAMGVYVMNAVNSGYHVYKAGKVGYGVQYADVGFRSSDTDTGIYAKGTQLAGYFDGNVKVASNITSDEFYKGVVTADSALVTKKYVDDQAGTVTYADSAGIAANAHKLQGKDTTAFAPTVHNHIGETWEANSGTYALRKKIDVNSSSAIYTQVDSATNSGSGTVYSGMFYGGGAGSGSKYGLQTIGKTSTSSAYGIGAQAYNDGSGQAVGGYFYGGGSGSGIKYGVQSGAYAPSASTNPVYGVWGYATHMGPQPAYGGYFYTSTNGSGPHYGVYAESDSFGIYAKSTSGTGNYAGYFDGNVKVASNVTSDDFYRGSVTADSALMTRKYIDQQVASAGTGSYHAPTLTVSMSPDSTGDWVCDGTSDDVEIQAALDQINTLGGGVIYVKQGTYNLANWLTVHSNTTLMGTGPGTVINCASPTYGILATTVTRVVIENLKVVGSTTSAICFLSVADGEIKQCWIETSGYNGIFLGGSPDPSHYNVVANNICNCSGNYCIHIMGYENIIQGNNCRNATSSCIYLNGAESNVVVGNVVDGAGSANGISLVSNSMDNTVTGNTLIKGQLYLSSSTWNTVSSNTVFQHQIYLSSSSWNTVVGNTVRGYTGGSGVYISTGSDFNTVSINICYGHNSSGIYLDASSNNTVTDNVCANNGQHGILITSDSDYNVVNDNRCINNTSTGIEVVSSNCDENVVQNNMLQGNGTSYSDSGTNTRDDDAGATGGVGGHITGGTANYE